MAINNPSPGGTLSSEQLAELLAMMSTTAARDWQMTFSEGSSVSISQTDVVAGIFLDNAVAVTAGTLSMPDGGGGNLLWIKAKNPILALTVGNSGMVSALNFAAPGSSYVLGNREVGKWEVVASF